MGGKESRQEPGGFTEHQIEEVLEASQHAPNLTPEDIEALETTALLPTADGGGDILHAPPSETIRQQTDSDYQGTKPDQE